MAEFQALSLKVSAKTADEGERARTPGMFDGDRPRLAADSLVGLEADAETEQMLLQAIAQCEKGETTPMAHLVSELRSRE